MSDPIKQPEKQPDLHDHLYEQYANISNSDYLQLPKEEQDRIFEVRQQRVRDAPTLYEWDIRVASVYGLAHLDTIVPCGILALIGIYLLPGKTQGGGIALITMAVLLFLHFRYLVDADRLYHYRLTTEGLVETEREAIPDVAYAVVRGLAWFGAVVCIAAVAVMGPAALVGAGGFAVGAFFFTGFKNQESTSARAIKNGQPHVIKVTRHRPYIECEAEIPILGYRASINFFCHADDMHKLLSLLMEQLPGSQIRLFKNERVLSDAPIASFDAGEPAQLSDFAPHSADS